MALAFKMTAQGKLSLTTPELYLEQSSNLTRKAKPLHRRIITDATPWVLEKRLFRSLSESFFQVVQQHPMPCSASIRLRNGLPCEADFLVDTYGDSKIYRLETN
jgi:hypothetical protein